MNEQSGNLFFDLLNILSVAIGLQNLQENREQSAHNDVQTANSQQAKFILSEISRQFEEQNRVLAQQNETLAEILEKLEELRAERHEDNLSVDSVCRQIRRSLLARKTPSVQHGITPSDD